MFAPIAPFPFPMLPKIPSRWIRWIFPLGVISYA